MTILSDDEIRERIESEQLVVGGDLLRAKFCSYEFVAGIFFFPGPESTPISWLNGHEPLARITIPPGGLVWIRTREEVRMPQNLCGLWWQTNRLSRQGLMLINMSIVEPGYEGPLTCAFVNFGKTPVAIFPDTNLAKLVFVNLSRPTAKKYGGIPGYNDALQTTALSAPATFLQVAKVSQLLEQQLQAARKEVLQSATEGAKQQEKILEDRAKAELADMKSDIQKSLRSASSLVVLAGVVVVAALQVSNCVTESLADKSLEGRIKKAVDAQLAARPPVVLVEQVPHGTAGTTDAGLPPDAGH